MDAVAEVSQMSQDEKMQRRVWIERALAKLNVYTSKEIVELRKLFEGEEISTMGQISIVPLLDPPEGLSTGEARMYKELQTRVFKT